MGHYYLMGTVGTDSVLLKSSILILFRFGYMFDIPNGNRDANEYTVGKSHQK